MYFYNLKNKIEAEGFTKENAYEGLQELVSCVGSCAFEYMSDADRELMQECLDKLDENNY